MFNSSRQSSDMAAEGRVMAATLLLFITFTQGNFGIKLVRMDMISTAVGQQVNLSCMMNSEDQNLNIAQIEWRKVEPQEHKIAIYNPSYGPYIHWKNISLYIDDFRGKLRGSILQLPAVDVWDSGRYVCELTTYPHGTVKEEKILTVTNSHLSARVMRPNRTVIEGDDVTILCTSTPPADTYSLWPSKNKLSILKSGQEGRFILPNVTKDDSGFYICQPGNSSSGLPFQDHNITIQLTVHYLGNIECDTSSSIEVVSGQNVRISCEAEASLTALYTWRKGNVTTSNNSSLHLHSVSSKDTGVYTLTAAIENTGLQREMKFNITVQTGSTALPLITASPYSATTNKKGYNTTPLVSKMETSMPRRITSTLLRTTNSTAPLYSRSDLTTSRITNVSIISNRTAAASELNHTTAATINPTLPFNVTPHWFKGNITGTWEESTVPSGPFTTPPDLKATVSITVQQSNNSSSTSSGNMEPTNPIQEPQGGKRFIFVILLPILALLVVIVILYRRHIIQKSRMDMPPPFKPPPPPVKYTSVRTQDIPMTEILKR